MAILDWMTTCFEDSIQDMTAVAEHLNSTRSPCCKEKAKFHLWDDEDEARLHRRITAMIKRMNEILIDLDGVGAKRQGRGGSFQGVDK